jgi:alpha-galactosidase
VIRPVLRGDGSLAGWNLESGASSYVIALYRGRYLAHYHWGARIAPLAASLDALCAPEQAYGVVEEAGVRGWSLHRLPQEYPWGLGGDFRAPAFSATAGHGAGGGSTSGAGLAAGPVLDLEYRAWRVLPGPPDLGGLPCLEDEPGLETLEIDLEDPWTGMLLSLSWTPVPGIAAFIRAARFSNRGAGEVRLGRAFSFSLDLPLPARGLELLSTEGGWARERQLERRPLGSGRVELGSRRGVSGHGSSPCLALAETGTTESSGQAWGCSLLYSGDWLLAAERNEDGRCRVQGGLHPELFTWSLGPGESFSTPAALLAHSGVGLGGLSRSFHAAARRLMPAAWRDRERPVLLNSWEAAYFSYDEERLLSIARGAAELGAELFVLDDGWFGKRDDDRTSLGDWDANPAKLPGGIPRLAGKVHALGLGFGLWMEPEMVSAESALFRAHPDWCLALPGRPPAEGRNQRILDLSRPEVAAHVEARVREHLATGCIDYLKWDMNRPFSRAGSAEAEQLPGGLRHRWLLGLYGILRRLAADFPLVLFEGCAGGGGRLDFGMLPFFPQFWASDNTDPLWRLGIQEGASLFFPPLALASHLSASPNHQTGRVTSLRARSRVAMGGVYGLELDPAALPPGELAAVRAELAWYKARRGLLQRGELFRLSSAAEGGDAAWALLAPDRSGAIVLWCRPRAIPGAGPVLLRLPGLPDSTWYRITSPDLAGWERRLAGAELAGRGLEFLSPGPEAGEPPALAFELLALPHAAAGSLPPGHNPRS